MEEPETSQNGGAALPSNRLYPSHQLCRSERGKQVSEVELSWGHVTGGPVPWGLCWASSRGEGTRLHRQALSVVFEKARPSSGYGGEGGGAGELLGAWQQPPAFALGFGMHQALLPHFLATLQGQEIFPFGGHTHDW